MTGTVVDRRLEGFLPPEGVPIGFEIGSIGSRFGAQILDILITYLSVTAIALLIFWTGALSWNAAQTLIVLMYFFVRIPYYIVAEMVWNGRTLGKRVARIRVISADGRRLTPHQIVARNLMKEVEIFMPGTLMFSTQTLGPVGIATTVIWVIGVLIVPLANRRRQRLGDMIAGTIVVENPKAVLLPDLAVTGQRASEYYSFLPTHLDIYGRVELQALEAILREPVKGPEHYEELRRVTETILRKIEYSEKVRPAEYFDFLTAFYRAQREHLETRRLFGDRRENKFHEAGLSRRFIFEPSHLEVYGDDQVQALGKLVKEPPKTLMQREEVDRVARAIIRKIGYADIVRQGDHFQFLMAFHRALNDHVEKQRKAADKVSDGPRK